MLNEPVRGSVPDPSLFSQSGLEMIRAYMRGLVPSTPLFRLLGPRVTQVSSGTGVLQQTISPWFEVNEDFVDLTPTAEYIVHVTALTGAPPSTYIQTVNLSLRYLRPCTVSDEMVIARGRILHAGSSFTTVEALIEDALGRAVAHAMGSVIVRAMDPPPPPLALPMQTLEEPVYATPDPVRRPLHRRGQAPGPDSAELDMLRSVSLSTPSCWKSPMTEPRSRCRHRSGSAVCIARCRPGSSECLGTWRYDKRSQRSPTATGVL